MKIFLLSLVIGIFVFSPFSVEAQTSNQERQQLLAQIQQLLAQINLLQKQLNEKKSGSFTSRILTEGTIVDTRYRIYNPYDFSWLEDNSHKEIANRFIELTPNSLDGKIEEIVFYSENDSIDAFVETLGSIDSWRVGFSDSLTDENVRSNSVTELLVHEIGHLVAYTESDGELLLDVYVDALDSTSNLRGYVSEYARTNDEEDFAETFMTYIFDNSYSGPGFEKVQFMKTLPGVTSYQTEILSNI